VNKVLIIALLFILCIATHGQTIGDQLYNDLNSNTRLDAITSDDEFIYIIGTSIDTIFPYYRIGVFYKVNIEENKVVDNIRLSSNLFEIDTKSNHLKIIDDSLHYIAIGYEFRDTIVNDQANFSYYQKFSYSLNTGDWTLKSIPAFDDQGRQFVTYSDSYFHEDKVYLIGERFDSLWQKKDLLVTCLHINGNTIWTKAFINTLSRGESQVLVDSNNDLIIGSALIFNPVHDSLDVLYNLNVLKLNTENGELLNSFLGKELTGSPRAIIQDVNDRGYIIASDNIIPQGRGRLKSSPRIVKLSNDFKEIIWETNVSNVAFAYSWHIDEFLTANDGNFIGVGRAGQIDDSDIILPGRIIKITGDGEIIWDKFVSRNTGDFRSNWLSDVTTHKEGFVACGVVFGPTDSLIVPIQQGWVVAFNANGDLDVRSSIFEFSDIKNEVSIFPNPAKEFVNIEISETQSNKIRISIYSISGQLVFETNESPVRNSIMLNLDNFDTGLYFVVLNSELDSYSQKIYIQR